MVLMSTNQPIQPFIGHNLTIPKNANGLSPKQQSFLNNYLIPSSATFGNAYQSAIKSGYKEHYARNILVRASEWIQNNVDKQALSEDHIVNGIQSIALDPYAKNSDRLKAFDMLAKIRGMMVQRNQSVVVNVDTMVD